MVKSAEPRVYDRSNVVVFHKTTAPFGGLSNMAAGYSLNVNGIFIRTSEALYQACRFPHLPEIQQLILSQASPMTAKMKSKPLREHSREDWNRVRIRIMRWCLQIKLAQNAQKFGSLLLSTGDRPIVEQSRRDPFWGAQPFDETLIGLNVLGRLLMELREEVKAVGFEHMLSVDPPDVSNFLLLDKPIGVITGEIVSARRDRPLLLLQGGQQLTIEEQLRMKEAR